MEEKRGEKCNLRHGLRVFEYKIGVKGIGYGLPVFEVHVDAENVAEGMGKAVELVRDIVIKEFDLPAEISDQELNDKYLNFLEKKELSQVRRVIRIGHGGD